MCRSLKERSLASSFKILVNDIEDLREAWDTLDTCFDRPEKYIAEALEPVVRFRSYKMFDNGAIREFYSLLRAAMMGARKAGLLHRLINDQTLPIILAKMPPNDWRQWARERPTWMREAIEEAFWGFLDQKWRDALNVAAAEPAGWVARSGRAAAHDSDKKGPAEAAKRLAQATIHVAAAEEKPQQYGEDSRRCIFADVLGCTGRYPPWKCGRFGNIRAKEREKIIEDNRLCAFCLLHNRALACGAKEKQNRPVCGVPECDSGHIIRLHEFLKDTYGERSRIHLVQGDDRWEEPEGAWVMGEAEEEDEAMLVNTAQQEESSWRETDDSWLELNRGEAGGVYCVGACHGEKGHAPGTKGGWPHETVYLSEEEGAVEAGWWTPDPAELQVSEEETEYLIDLLMRGHGAEEDEAGPTQASATPNAPSRKIGGRGATGRENQPQKGVRENGLPMGKEPRKGTPKRQEASYEGALRGGSPGGSAGTKGGSEASTRLGAGEADAGG